MTISTLISRETYNGDGSSTNFAVNFPFFKDSDLVVIEKVTATGGETVKTLTADYTVSGGNGGTGTVTAIVAPPSTVTWTIYRDTSKDQLADYPSNDSFPSKTHERGLDKLTLIAQELSDALKFAIKFSKASNALNIKFNDPKPNDYFHWNNTGTEVEYGPIVPLGMLGLPVAIVDGGTGATTVEGARINLELSTKGSPIASATNITLGNQDYYVVTGTTNISSFSAKPAGYEITLLFSDVLNLIHSANLILPLAANITTYNGFFIKLISEGGGVWRMESFAPYTAPSPLGYRFKSRIFYLANSTWNKTADTAALMVHVLAGGGGAGGAKGAASHQTAGVSGAGGGAAVKWILAAALGASETVTIGAGGTGGLGATPSAGGNGGTTSFGSHVSATGGTGGPGITGVSILTVSPTQVGGGNGVGGDINYYGEPGKVSNMYGGGVVCAPGGRGGGLFGGYSPPTPMHSYNSASLPVVGQNAAANTGSGGNGGITTYNAATTANGGNGGSGLCVVDEYVI